MALTDPAAKKPLPYARFQQGEKQRGFRVFPLIGDHNKFKKPGTTFEWGEKAKNGLYHASDKGFRATYNLELIKEVASKMQLLDSNGCYRADLLGGTARSAAWALLAALNKWILKASNCPDEAKQQAADA